MSKRTLKIHHLVSGGIITNYYCSSCCRHCLYAAGPGWMKEYINQRRLLEVIKKLKDLGCNSIHIGGGEPFLDAEGLKMVVRNVCNSNLQISYVETNSSWYKDHKQAVELLSSLRQVGLHTLLISISPFHNEFIPLSRVNGVLQASADAGMLVFPWIQEFLKDISHFDPDRSHKLEEYQAVYGNDYIKNIPDRYWITLRGRALKTYASYMEVFSCDQILARNPWACSELFDTSHFHIDLFGNYIPGLCSGLSIQIENLGQTLSKTEYPFLCSLMEHGINGLFKLAETRYGFEPEKKYMSKCDLCNDIRSYLVLKKGLDVKDLKPVEFYKQIN